jgi:hypothetical protein
LHAEKSSVAFIWKLQWVYAGLGGGWYPDINKTTNTNTTNENIEDPEISQ